MLGKAFESRLREGWGSRALSSESDLHRPPSCCRPQSLLNLVISPRHSVACGRRHWLIRWQDGVILAQICHLMETSNRSFPQWHHISYSVPLGITIERSSTIVFWNLRWVYPSFEGGAYLESVSKYVGCLVLSNGENADEEREYPIQRGIETKDQKKKICKIPRRRFKPLLIYADAMCAIVQSHTANRWGFVLFPLLTEDTRHM